MGKFAELRRERQHRRAMAREERLQRSTQRLEVRLQKHNARGMAREDRSSHVWQRKQELTELVLMRKIRRLLAKWHKTSERKLKQMRRRESINEVAQHDRQQRGATRKAQQQQRSEHRARWHWMNRRDITMADLIPLHSKPPDQQ